MVKTYVCAEIDENSANGDGFSGGGGNYIMCKKWVELPQSDFFGLALTQQEVFLIGGFLVTAFAMFISYLVIVKSIKIA